MEQQVNLLVKERMLYYSNSIKDLKIDHMGHLLPSFILLMKFNK